MFIQTSTFGASLIEGILRQGRKGGSWSLKCGRLLPGHEADSRYCLTFTGYQRVSKKISYIDSSSNCLVYLLETVLNAKGCMVSTSELSQSMRARLEFLSSVNCAEILQICIIFSFAVLLALVLPWVKGLEVFAVE